MKFLLLLLLGAPQLCAGAEETLRFLVPTYLSQPIAHYSKESALAGKPVLDGGILFDWQNALADQLHRHPAIVMIPRNRVQYSNDNIDAFCFTKPEWLRNAKNNFHWPKPYFAVENWIVGPKTSPTITSLQDLKGKSVGTVLGYQYAEFDPLFSAGQIHRDDAPNEDRMIDKQLLGRHDYMLIRSINFIYQARTRKDMGKLVASPSAFEVSNIYCALKKDGQVRLEEFQKAQDSLILDGTFKRILEKYH